MKILFVSQYFYPEVFKGNDIVFDLVNRGHDVTVLTGKPNYPSGKFYDGYSFFNKREEVINGVKVIRSPLFPRKNGGGIALALNYVSFVFFSYFTFLFRIKDKYDIVLAQQLSPISMVIPGIWVKKAQKIPMVMWVLDLWPDSLVESKNIKSKYLTTLLDSLVKKIYDSTDVILISSNFFKKSIIENCSDKSKQIEYFPNWAEDVYTENYVSKKTCPTKPEGFNIMFAGNVGDSQDFETILKAAKLTENTKINWIIVGDGRKLNWVKDQVALNNITNVFLWGRFPLSMMPLIFRQADAMLVSLKNIKVFSLTVPAKLQAYMASSKMIVGMLNGEGNHIIKESNCGVTCNAGDATELINSVISLSKLDQNQIIEKQKNAKRYYDEHFSKKMLFDKLESIMEKQLIK